MIDILALQEELTDTQIRLKAMERAYFEKIFECDVLKQKMEDMKRETMPVLCSTTNAS